jgi:hypothetical protein
VGDALWTVEEVAAYFDVSQSRARSILAENGIQRTSGYSVAAVKAIQRPGQGTRTDLKEKHAAS